MNILLQPLRKEESGREKARSKSFSFKSKKSANNRTVWGIPTRMAIIKKK